MSRRVTVVCIADARKTESSANCCEILGRTFADYSGTLFGVKTGANFTGGRDDPEGLTE